MKLCLVAPPVIGSEGADGRAYGRLAELLATRHEVTVIRCGEATEDDASYREVVAKPGAELEQVVFAGAGHRLSAAVMEAIEAVYGDEGPDYVEVGDRGAHGLVPLMARRCGNPLFERTLFSLRLLGSAELEALHDGNLGSAPMRLLSELERYQLRLADRLIRPGGDVLDLYRRYYDEPLPSAVCLPLPPVTASPEATRHAGGDGGPLRILYIGELRRSAGAIDLATACLRLPVDEWELTMVGADTDTAPAGQSAELTIREMLGGDPRLTVEPELDEAELGRHDLLVVPPTFAVWPQVAQLGMGAGLPILATPVGGLPDLVEHGATGWLSEDTGAEALRASLLHLLERPEELQRVRASGRIQERFAALTDPAPLLDGYERLLGRRDKAVPAPSRPEEPPLVSGVLPYHRNAAFVEEAVRSLLEQTHSRVEAVIVNDGSFEPGDAVLDRLASDPRVRVVTQLNRGEAVARNLGARLSRGEYVVMLDADNVLEPRFVSRALEVFAREPDLAYVSCWLHFIGPDGADVSEPAAGYAPLGNSVVRDDTNNWDGDTLALLPRGVFSEFSAGFDPAAVIYSDWEFYRLLRERGLFGVVIPEKLARYRVLGSSLQRAHGSEFQRRGWEEARGRRQLRATHWTADA